MRSATLLACSMLLGLMANAQMSGQRLPDKVNPYLGSIKFEAPVSERKVVDGDTIWMGIHELRLHGIDAVEPRQDCRMAGQKVPCHSLTVAELEKWVFDPDFFCVGYRQKNGEPWMSYGRYNAVCHLGGAELNESLVSHGWAFASNKSAGDYYRSFEAKAESNNLGLHAMSVDRPWDWRKKDRGDRCGCEED